MEWNVEADAVMAGDDAARVLDAARMAWMLASWQAGEVLGVACGPRHVAALRVTQAGRVQCVALVPCEAWHPGEVRREVEVFARPFPSDWMTKRRAGNARPVPVDAQGYGCGWCCGILPGRSVILARVLDWQGDSLHAVQTLPDGPRVEVAQHDAARWWPFHRWPDGAAALFEMQAGRAIHNYRLACIQAANLDRKAKGLPAISGQAGKKLKAAKKAIDGAD